VWDSKSVTIINKLPQTSPNLDEEASSSSRQFPVPDYAALRDRASQSPEVAKRCQLVLGDWCGPYIVQVNNCKIFNESASAVFDALAVHPRCPPPCGPHLDNPCHAGPYTKGPAAKRDKGLSVGMQFRRGKHQRGSCPFDPHMAVHVVMPMV
jgi:hypothetical protein